MWLLCDCWRGGSGCWRGGVVLGALLLRRFDARCRTPPPLPTLSHFPRVVGGSSLTSPWFGVDPLSHPPGCGCGSSLTSPGLGPGALSRPLGWVGLAAGRVGDSGVRLVVAPWARAAGCPCTFRRPLTSPRRWGRILSHVPRVWGRIFSHIPRVLGRLPAHFPGVGLAAGRVGHSGVRLVVLPLGARCRMSLHLPMLSHFPGVGGGSSLTTPGVGGGSSLMSGLMSWGLCCVMGFTGVCFWCLGVFCGGGVGVFVVFSGFLGGVGVDLVWGWGACKVIRVAAADAEMMVTDSLQIAGFGGALVRFRVGVGGLGLVCFVRLVRVTLKSCSGAILDPGGCGWCR